MNNYDTDWETIEHILSTTETIAVVGLSSSRRRAGYYVPAYLQENGYRIIPVNPNLESALGEKAYPDLTSVPDSIDLVLIFRRSEHVRRPAELAVEVGSKAVWMQLGIYNEEAAEIALNAGLKVVMDACMLVEHRRWAGSAHKS
ncbi:MAG TPA: CoA-binding protein [candidate division Zixibacteria bacterium]|nr:CoA-binding protein [candidate division Zixibacteria bacterium]